MPKGSASFPFLNNTVTLLPIEQKIEINGFIKQAARGRSLMLCDPDYQFMKIAIRTSMLLL